AYGALAGLHGQEAAMNVQGEPQYRLDVLANQQFLQCLRWGGNVRGLLSEEMEDPWLAGAGDGAAGGYLLGVDPLDGSSNIDVNVSVGSIFSVLRVPESDRPVCIEDFLQPGVRQVAAGYALYGPSTMFVLTVGHGTHGFTLNPELGEFLLTHPDLRVPEDTQE